MNGITHITLNKEQYRVRFNNYFRSEISKIFLKEGEAMLTGDQLSQRIIDKWRENETLLIRDLVYAGICGDSYVTLSTPRLTLAEVGEHIGEAPAEELFAIWRLFLDAQGYNLSREEGEEVKKKKSKTPKKPTKKS